MTWNCTNCGGTQFTTTSGEHPYRALPGTILYDVEIHSCESCGEKEVSIPAIDELNQLIAHDLLATDTLLSGPEVRFLRKTLGWSGADFADQFELRAETVSRIERGRQPVNPRIDKLLRLAIARKQRIDDYELEDLLRRRSREASGVFEVRLTHEQDGWRKKAC